MSAATLRKISVGREGDRKAAAERKPMYLSLLAEKIEFEERCLRILGTVKEGNDDVAAGSYHSFNIEKDSILTIEKEWPAYQRKKLEESSSSEPGAIMIMVFDREEAYFALMKQYGFEILSHMEGQVKKKGYDQGKVSNFYNEIISALEEYDKRYSFQTIIAASPSFWKDELSKNLTSSPIRKKIVFAACSSVGKEGVAEVLRRNEVKEALSRDRTAKEMQLVEELKKEIATNGKAAYGWHETRKAIDRGAAETVLVTDALILQKRKEKSFGEMEDALKKAEQQRAQVHIISSFHEGGKILDGLGGIGAILRYAAF